ncbi:hypothetical protein GGF46_001809 [Coemansia sp. RSA 552]|nr:hypothetical protein GGF46_001809 [Coemansia sp. RSA 552]
MLAEETEKPEDTQLKEKLQYFLNPRELRTPITATDSGANRNVQALRNRSEEDEGQVARGRMQSQDVSRMLRELQGARVSDDAVQQAVQRYGLDAETVRRLAAFLHSS